MSTITVCAVFLAVFTSVAFIFVATVALCDLVDRAQKIFTDEHEQQKD